MRLCWLVWAVARSEIGTNPATSCFLKRSSLFFFNLQHFFLHLWHISISVSEEKEKRHFPVFLWKLSYLFFYEYVHCLSLYINFLPFDFSQDIIILMNSVITFLYSSSVHNYSFNYPLKCQTHLSNHLLVFSTWMSTMFIYTNSETNLFFLTAMKLIYLSDIDISINGKTIHLVTKFHPWTIFSTLFLHPLHLVRC